MAISLYTTADRSHTLYNDEQDETYPSRNGPFWTIDPAGKHYAGVKNGGIKP